MNILRKLKATVTKDAFLMRCKCYHSFRKNNPLHNVFLALCIVSGEVKDSKCSCVAGSLGYCNHSLALMLKACKFSLYGSQNTKDLEMKLIRSQCKHAPQNFKLGIEKVAVKPSILSLLWMSLFQNQTGGCKTWKRRNSFSPLRGKK